MTQLEKPVTPFFAQAFTAGFSSSSDVREDLGRVSAIASKDAARIGAKMRAAVGVTQEDRKGTLTRFLTRLTRKTTSDA